MPYLISDDDSRAIIHVIEDLFVHLSKSDARELQHRVFLAENILYRATEVVRDGDVWRKKV